MLQTVKINQSVEDGNRINFGCNVIQTGCTATHEECSEIIKLNKAGFYMIALTGNIKATEDEDRKKTDTQEIELTFYRNCDPIAGAVIEQTIDDDTENVAKTFLIQVYPDHCTCKKSVDITVVATGGDIDVTNLQVSVTKL